MSKDAFHGPDILTNAAEIYALLGEKDRALAALNKLTHIPSLITVQALKLDPVWDSLQDDPRFQ